LIAVVTGNPLDALSGLAVALVRQVLQCINRDALVIAVEVL